MRRFFILLPLLLLSCAASTDISVLRPPDAPAGEDILRACRSLATPGRAPRRLVHSIEARFPKGGTSVLMGVTRADCVSGVIRSVLLTVEGMVLFDGEIRPDKKSGPDAIEVHRSLPPFDRPELAAGLLSDVALTTCLPDRTPDEIGLDEQGRGVCRFRDSQTVLDLLPEDGGWTLSQYARASGEDTGRLQRTIQSASDTTILTAHDAGYSLRLRLISAESLKESAP